MEAAVDYCAIEAIQNAIKHGGPAVHIAFALSGEPDELSFMVEDDGAGLEPDAARAGMGLQNMRDRLGAIDGHLAIDTAPGRGTTVTGTIPLHAGAAVRTLELRSGLRLIRRPGHRTPPETALKK